MKNQATHKMHEKFHNGDRLTDIELQHLLNYYTGLKQVLMSHNVPARHHLFMIDVINKESTLLDYQNARKEK